MIEGKNNEHAQPTIHEISRAETIFWWVVIGSGLIAGSLLAKPFYRLLRLKIYESGTDDALSKLSKEILEATKKPSFLNFLRKPDPK